jgi:ataxin-3
MVLEQAEKEGYSVFVVRKARHEGGEGTGSGEGQGWTDGGIGVLPECIADRMALQLGEPSGRGGAAPDPSRQGEQCVAGPHTKLMKASGSGATNPDVPTVDASSLPAQAGPSSPPARRNRRQEDLEPQSPDSEAFPTEPVRRPSRNAPQGNLDYDEEISSDDFEMDMDPTGQPTSRSARANQYDPIMNEAEPAGPSDFTFQSRSYDDEDQALQAALKASMEDLPADWKAPEPKPVRKSITSAADRMKAAQDKAQAALKRESDLRAEVEAEEKKRQKEAKEEDEEEKLEDLSPGKLSIPSCLRGMQLTLAEEIRRRRLARFG